MPASVLTLGSQTCPRRFLFVVDDGRGDVSGKSFDLGYRAVDHDHGWLMLGAADLGIPVPASRAADMLLALAQEFLTVSRLSGDVWHVRELPSWTTSVPGVRTLNLPLERTDVPLGAVGGAASVQVPLGSLTPAQAATIEASAAGRGRDHTIARACAAWSRSSTARAGRRRPHRRCVLSMVGDLGLRRCAVVPEVPDRYARVRDEVG